MSTVAELMMNALLGLLRTLATFVTLTIVLIDALSFGQLLALAVVLRFVALHVPSGEAQYLAPRTAAPIMLAYFGYFAFQVGDHWPQLFVALLRSLLAYVVMTSFLIPIFVLAKAISETLRYLGNHLYCGLIGARRHTLRGLRVFASLFHRRPPALVPDPPAPAPLSRNDRMRKLAETAQADFESEEAVVRALPLDEDERDVLILQAKQRLLQKLSHLPEV